MKNYRKYFKEYYGINFDETYEIHHIDFNHNNNNIENLMLLPKELHNRYHTILNSMYLTTPVTKIYGFTDSFGGFNEMLLNNLKKFMLVYQECQKWKDYKKFLDGEIPNIHNIEVIYERK